MIVFEFRFHEHFQSVCRLLESYQLPFDCEAAREEWRPSYIWLFEESVRTETQEQVLRKARAYEQVDRFRQRRASMPNLAVPQ